MCTITCATMCTTITCATCALLMPHSHCIAICLHSQYFILTTSHTLILHCCHVLTLSNNVGSGAAIWHHLFSPHSQVSHCQLLRCICISQMLHWSEKNDLESQNGPERTEPEFRYHGLISKRAIEEGKRSNL